MSTWEYDRPVFRTGWHAVRAEFRSTDTSGRPVDPTAETPTARDERVRALQDLRLAQGPREAPPTDPRLILAEWMAQSAVNRMSAFALSVAEHPERAPEAEVFSPGSTPKPGGLLERIAAVRQGRGSAA